MRYSSVVSLKLLGKCRRSGKRWKPFLCIQYLLCMCVCVFCLFVWMFYYGGAFFVTKFQLFRFMHLCGILIYIIKWPESIEFWQGCRQNAEHSVGFSYLVGTRTIKHWPKLCTYTKTNKNQVITRKLRQLYNPCMDGCRRLYCLCVYRVGYVELDPDECMKWNVPTFFFMQNVGTKKKLSILFLMIFSESIWFSPRKYSVRWDSCIRLWLEI